MVKKNQGRAVLISGCSTGIGRATAFALQDRGYKVIASARREKDLKSLSDAGLKHVLELDLADSASVQRAARDALELCDGKLYALFNNAGFGQPGAVEDVTRDALREQFETNVFGLHELTRALMPSFLAQREGRIIQHSSILGFLGMSYRGAYVSSKFALEGLSDVMRLELKGTGIFVSLIEPGPIVSQFRANALEAFERNVDIESSRHKAHYNSVLGRLKKEGPAMPFTLGPEAVVKRVVHALESKSPKPRYYVTTPTYVFAFIKRLLSHRQFDMIINKAQKL